MLAAYRTQLVQPGRPRQREEGPGRLQGAAALGVSRPAAPKAAPAIDFIKPLTPAKQKTSLQFFNILNFVLQFCPTDPSETELMARFARIGVGAGKTFDASKLSPEVKTAIEQGMADAWADFDGIAETNRCEGR